ncbi:MAG: hypothetical protein R2790_08820 [Flavobacterium haoranii]
MNKEKVIIIIEPFPVIRYGLKSLIEKEISIPIFSFKSFTDAKINLHFFDIQIVFIEILINNKIDFSQLDYLFENLKIQNIVVFTSIEDDGLFIDYINSKKITFLSKNNTPKTILKTIKENFKMNLLV